MLEKICEKIYESRILYGAKIWGIEGGGIQGKSCKKLLRIPRNVAKWAAETELGRNSRRGKILSTVIKYWGRVKKSVEEELVR
jgi:hypothetical protein